MTTLSLTYAELAERLGISVDGARMKVKRQRWPKTKGNDGAVRVMVEEEELAPNERSPNVRAALTEQPNEQVGEQVRTLEAHIATLKEQLAKAETMAAQERARVEDLTASMMKLTAQMMELQAKPWWRRLTG